MMPRSARLLVLAAILLVAASCAQSQVSCPVDQYPSSSTTCSVCQTGLTTNGQAGQTYCGWTLPGYVYTGTAVPCTCVTPCVAACAKQCDMYTYVSGVRSISSSTTQSCLPCPACSNTTQYVSVDQDASDDVCTSVASQQQSCAADSTTCNPNINTTLWYDIFNNQVATTTLSRGCVRKIGAAGLGAGSSGSGGDEPVPAWINNPCTSALPNNTYNQSTLQSEHLATPPGQCFMNRCYRGLTWQSINAAGVKSRPELVKYFYKVTGISFASITFKVTLSPSTTGKVYAGIRIRLGETLEISTPNMSPRPQFTFTLARTYAYFPNISTYQIRFTHSNGLAVDRYHGVGFTSDRVHSLAGTDFVNVPMTAVKITLVSAKLATGALATSGEVLLSQFYPNVCAPPLTVVG